MTHLRQLMIAELGCGNFAESTIRSYIRAVEQFSRYFQYSPHRLGPSHVRQYQEETTIYLHLSNRHLGATASPLDALTTRQQGEQTPSA